VVWPPIAAALFSGFGLLLLGAVFPWLGSWLGWCCQLSLKATDWLIGVGATRLGSHFWTPSPPTWWVVGFYVLLIAWAALPRLRPSRRITLCISVLWLALGALTIIAASWRRSDDQLICTFYCVGHGTCVAIE